MQITEPLQFYMPIPLNSLPLNDALDFPLFVRIGDRHIQLRAIKESLTQERAESLKQRIDTLFVPSNYWLRYLEMLEKKYTMGASDIGAHLKNLHALILAYGKHLEDSTDDQNGAVNKLRSLGYELAGILTEQPDLTKKAITRFREFEIYFAAHNANVAVYSVAIANKLGFSIDELKFLTFACLVHNIGNNIVPKQILYKPGEFYPAERRAMEKHPAVGAQLLEYLNCPSEVVLTAKQHHERIDGKGYPARLGNVEIHKFAKICSIADTFDAMTSNRPYKKAIRGEEAVKLMQIMNGKFDSQILKNFGSA